MKVLQRRVLRPEQNTAPTPPMRLFQLDLYGQLRRATEAGAPVASPRNTRRTSILTLVSDVRVPTSRFWRFDLQLQITQGTSRHRRTPVKLTRLRVEHGVATKLDVLQAQQVLDTANAQIPEFERQIGQMEDAISILLGDYPHGVARGTPLVDQRFRPKYRGLTFVAP